MRSNSSSSSAQLAAFALAAVMTSGTLGGIHTLSANEASAGLWAGAAALAGQA